MSVQAFEKLTTEASLQPRLFFSKQRRNVTLSKMTLGTQRYTGAAIITAINRTAAASAFALLALGLAACNNDAAQPNATKTAAPSASVSGSGVIKTSVGDYRFTPTTCAIGISGGMDDVEIGGAGVGPDGAPIYVEFSSTADALTIGLGVDKPFATAEHQIQGGRVYSQPIDVAVSGRTVQASGVALKTDNGEPVDDNASFEIHCS